MSKKKPIGPNEQESPNIQPNERGTDMHKSTDGGSDTLSVPSDVREWVEAIAMLETTRGRFHGQPKVYQKDVIARYLDWDRLRADGEKARAAFLALGAADAATTAPAAPVKRSGKK
jgi:hypothetical protein